MGQPSEISSNDTDPAHRMVRGHETNKLNKRRRGLATNASKERKTMVPKEIDRKNKSIVKDTIVISEDIQMWEARIKLKKEGPPISKHYRRTKLPKGGDGKSMTSRTPK